jgi:hypothetical protein
MGDIPGVCAGLVDKVCLFMMRRDSAHGCARAQKSQSRCSQSEQSLLPRDILDQLGQAFNELKG